MAKITIDRVVEDETDFGIEFSRVYFSVEGNATAEEINAILAAEMDDLTNLNFELVAGRGTFVTIDFGPKVGATFEIPRT
ncbi:hypothetical protein ACO0LB_17910 [Undibacterium sp. SXout7W]|uniref:hypothetical protein n=1 Tax=Undibacterium sp. SXout7W TaxID=3413049 RepID=UPI003BF2232E